MRIKNNIYNKRENILYKSTTVAFFFFALYNVRFIFTPVNTALIIATAGIIVLFFATITRKIEIKFGQIFLLVIAMYFLLFVWIIFRTLATNFLDTNFIVIGSKIILQAIPNSIFAVYLIKKKHKTSRDFIKIIQVCISIQSVFIILTFLSNNFRMFTNQIIPLTGNIPATSIYRIRGITNSTGAALSTIQSLGLLFTVHLLINGCINKRKRLFLLISIPIILISIALTGNTGFLMIGFVIIYLFMIQMKRVVISAKMIKRLILGLIILIIAFTLFNYLYTEFGVNTMPWGEDALQRVIRKITDEFAINNGSILPYTVQKLLESHYHLPDDINTFILGNPLSWEYHRVMSDVGYIRNIYGIGVIGSIITYSTFLLIFLAIKKRTGSFSEKALARTLMLWLLVIEMKEPFILQPYYVFIYLSIFSYYYINFERKEF